MTLFLLALLGCGGPSELPQPNDPPAWPMRDATAPKGHPAHAPVVDGAAVPADEAEPSDEAGSADEAPTAEPAPAPKAAAAEPAAEPAPAAEPEPAPSATP